MSFEPTIFTPHIVRCIYEHYRFYCALRLALSSTSVYNMSNMEAILIAFCPKKIYQPTIHSTPHL